MTHLPCGQCLGCRLAKSMEWATRIHHEAQMHDENCFVTLTFSDDFLPANHSINPRDVQLWMKRLRKAVGHNRIRYFACGEYGERGFRPHYHAILFGWKPNDLVPWRKTKSGHVVSRSAFLEKTWPFGHVEVGTVTLESAGYVARYVVKKVNGNAAEAHYRRADAETGETWNVLPEFILMSTKPGIGRAWYDAYSSDAFPSDFVIINGQKRPVPAYYKKQLIDDDQQAISMQREERAKVHADNNTPERLAVREESQTLRARRLHRELDNES